MQNIKVFEVDEDNWIAAENSESAANYYKEMVGDEKDFPQFFACVV